MRYRWSPRSFAPRAVAPEMLRAVFEAARWAPSSFNEQPWRFLVATRDEPEWLRRLQDYLDRGNGWARTAPVLVATAYRTHSPKTNERSRVAQRDLGAAEQNMFLQATALGLGFHQIAGFDHERLQRTLLPPGFAPGTLIAIGYPCDADATSVTHPSPGATSRSRLPLADFVFRDEWGVAASFASTVDQPAPDSGNGGARVTQPRLLCYE
ncbi:MAG TPA: nitroreductase family protein [Gemmatimonadales bacterium]|nr:nitroreductase family protein [Gemmatimonadales bacterium]